MAGAGGGRRSGPGSANPKVHQICNSDTMKTNNDACSMSVGTRGPCVIIRRPMTTDVRLLLLLVDCCNSHVVQKKKITPIHMIKDVITTPGGFEVVT